MSEDTPVTPEPVPDSPEGEVAPQGETAPAKPRPKRKREQEKKPAKPKPKPKPKGPLARKQKPKQKSTVKTKTRRVRKPGYLKPSQRRKVDLKNPLAIEVRNSLAKILKESKLSPEQVAKKAKRSRNWAPGITDPKASVPSLQTIDHFARSLGYKASLSLTKVGAKGAPVSKKSRKK